MSSNIKKTQSSQILMQNPQKGYSNDVFYDENSNSYYLSARVRLKFKMFKQIKMEDLRAQMDGTLIISVYYGGLPQYLVKQIRQGIVVNFNLDDPFRLKDGVGTSVQVQEKKQEISYYYRGTFKMMITSDVFWSPFDLIQLVLSVNLLKIIVYKRDEKGDPTYEPEATIKFNMMNCDDEWTKISFTSIGKFGHFDLAEKKMQVQYTYKVTASAINLELSRIARPPQLAHIIPSQLKEKKMKEYQYAHFTLPVYKFPLPTLTTIFLPLLLLSILNLCIFKQQHDLASRVASIGALLIAFVGLIPNIRAQIPPSDQVTFVELLVCLMAFTSVLCLVHSILGSTMDTDSFYYYDVLLYQTSKWLTIICILLVIVLFEWHRCRMAKYNLSSLSQKSKPTPRQQWYNNQCDKMCEDLSDFGVVKWSKYPQEKKENLLRIHKQGIKKQQ